jgi:hypothetical protein
LAVQNLYGYDSFMPALLAPLAFSSFASAAAPLSEGIREEALGDNAFGDDACVLCCVYFSAPAAAAAMIFSTGTPAALALAAQLINPSSACVAAAMTFSTGTPTALALAAQLTNASVAKFCSTFVCARNFNSGTEALARALGDNAFGDNAFGDDAGPFGEEALDGGAFQKQLHPSVSGLASKMEPKPTTVFSSLAPLVLQSSILSPTFNPSALTPIFDNESASISITVLFALSGFTLSFGHPQAGLFGEDAFGDDALGDDAFVSHMPGVSAAHFLPSMSQHTTAARSASGVPEVFKVVGQLLAMDPSLIQT